MVLTDLFFVFLTVLVVGGVFSLFLRRGGPWPGAFWFFVMLFFGTWALGAWFQPIGPPAYGVFWVPFVIAALVIALLLAAATPLEPPPASGGEADESETVAAARVALGVFFWLLLLFAVVAIMARYLWPP